jgi:hypothetical protein
MFEESLSEKVVFSFMLRHGMPLEQLQFNTFQTAMFQSWNAEEALLVIMNACALRAKKTTPHRAS